MLARIAGIFAPNGSARGRQSAVLRAQASMDHAGIAETKVSADEYFVLAHGASVAAGLETEDDEIQPLISQGGALSIVFSGELRNRVELREQLAARGRPLPASASEARLVLTTYEEFGRACPEYLDGVFAFAIADRRGPALFLARDRIASRPLHYAIDGGALIFASEIEAIRRMAAFERKLSLVGVTTYFSYLQSTAPWTLYEGIQKLPPAHFMFVPCDLDLAVRPYWQLRYEPKARGSLDELTDELSLLLTAELEEWLSRWPAAMVALSGGVDSSLVLSLAITAARLLATSAGSSPRPFGPASSMSAPPRPRPVGALAIGASLGATDFDPEFVRARRAAAHAGADLECHALQERGFDALLAEVRAYDEPVGIVDVFHYPEIFRRARSFANGAIVSVMTGNGADALFGGGGGFVEFRRDELRGSEALSNHAPARGSLEQDLFRRERARFIAVADGLFAKRTSNHVSALDVRGLLKPFLALIDYEQTFDLHQFLELYVRQPQILTLDGMVDAPNRVPTFSPFLTRSVMAFAATLPIEAKVGIGDPDRTSKIILRRLAHRLIPAELVYAPKLGCGQSLDYLERFRGPWRSELEAYIRTTTEELPEIFDAGKVALLWEDHLVRRLTRERDFLLRKLIVFCLWFQEVFKAR